MNIELLDKTYFAEIPIGASNTAQQYLFPTLNNLDGKFTQGIETYSVDLLTKSPGGATPANNNLLKCSYLVLFMGDVQQLWNIPLINLITTRNALATSTMAFNPFAVELNNLRVIWAKSYVYVADTSKIAGAAESFVFNIKFTDGFIKEKDQSQ